MPKVKLEGYECTRCSHVWVPRKDIEPEICPSCKSPYWNRQRKERNK